MNKKLIALAIASAFVAPVAMADNSSVVISGQMHVSVDSLDGGNHLGAGPNPNTSNTRQTNVSSNASFLSFDGKEDLGNGLNAIWKLKTYVSLGGTGNSGDPLNASTDGFTNGPAYVGLSGASWGAVKLGKDEGPMKMLSRKTDLFTNQIGDTRNLSSEFETRPNNAIEYNSPSMGGFSVNAMYSTNLTTSSTTLYGANPNTFATSNSVSLRSVTAVYDAGPFFVGLGYESHSLSDVSTSTLKDESAMRVAAGGNIGDFKLVGSYERNRDFKGVDNADFNFYGVGGAYKMGSNTIKAQFYKATSMDNATSKTGGGAKMYAIGFEHHLSKRTMAYLDYARTDNDNNAAYSAFGGGHGDNPGTVVGGNPSGFSVGMIHNF